ncbi:putative protein kinase RLK-Pelle-DLSV family [Helianthus annuus]|nr:putative protein kinase RLK-Pelle-DLSV family [Helianthus annuus]
MFLSLIFLWMPVLIFTATAAEFKTHFCELNTTSHINNTIFYSNLIQVLDSLASDTLVSDKQFLYNSTGIQPNIAYGLYLCRADVLPNDCRNCLLEVREDINKSCFLSKAAVSWSDSCMLRYANYSMVSVMNSATFVPECNKCTPDLSGSDCGQCLRTSIDRLSQYCYGKEGARVLAASCDVRFEIYKFLQFPAASSQNQDAGKKKIPSKIIAGIAAVGFLVVATAICFLFFVQKRLRPNTSSHELKDETDETEMMTEQSLQFELDTILEATNNFSIENKVGEGGFGVVYKGILPNGLEIAVKRLSKSSGQGSLEFKNEVVLLAKLQHRNLVRLLGFCLHAEEKILIYEYVANHSLDFFLFGPTKDVKLDWSSRYRIIGGIARGMLYLHEDSRLRIIHRDLKASNVLLDEEMNPKISDFGMARIVCGSQTQAMTNRIVGTFGYMSPEYAMHGHFSVKSDVFSFGVLVLEIISGKRNTRIFESGYTDLLCYAWSKWKNAEAMEILDSNMVDSSLENEALRCINIALLCVQEDDELRPSMASVVLMLNSYSIALSVPQNPPFVSRKRVKYTSDLLESDNSVCTVWHTDATAITDVDPR